MKLESVDCIECDGTGECQECGGEEEDCEICSGSGECQECDGAGSLIQDVPEENDGTLPLSLPEPPKTP